MYVGMCLEHNLYLTNHNYKTSILEAESATTLILTTISYLVPYFIKNNNVSC